MPDLKPLPGKILVEFITRSDARAEEVKKRSGLLLPEAEFQGAPDRGVVYAVGPDVDPQISVGRTVFFKDDTPKGFEWEGRKLFALEARQILGVAVWSGDDK